MLKLSSSTTACSFTSGRYDMKNINYPEIICSLFLRLFSCNSVIQTDKAFVQSITFIWNSSKISSTEWTSENVCNFKRSTFISSSWREVFFSEHQKRSEENIWSEMRLSKRVFYNLLITQRKEKWLNRRKRWKIFLLLPWQGVSCPYII